jgi:hypothetical protein
MYVMYFDADCRVRTANNEWFVECSCGEYAKSSTCNHIFFFFIGEERGEEEKSKEGEGEREI